MAQPSARTDPFAIAANRFGLGLRPADAVPDLPQRWLMAQLDRYDATPLHYSTLPTGTALARRHLTELAAIRVAEQENNERQKALGAWRHGVYKQEVERRFELSLSTSASFAERLVHFWSNHFAISGENPNVLVIAGAFEREAIRPHVLGRFTDMLAAVEQHPAMIRYLDQQSSAGPNSPAAIGARKRGAERGINENLAREMMELHTLGVRSGYDQEDVRELALALTGWSLAGERDEEEGRAINGDFIFRPGAHEPGTRRVLDKDYPQKTKTQGDAIIADLARAPQTARHIATKLARHFRADEPPASLVDRLADAFERSGGDLPTVYAALVDAPEMWQPECRKFKSPWEWAVSGNRALGRASLQGKLNVVYWMRALGQPVWQPRSPAGYDDITRQWLHPEGLIRRVEFSRVIVSQAARDLDPRATAQSVLRSSLSERTATEIGRAESIASGLALLLAAPEFQKR